MGKRSIWEHTAPNFMRLADGLPEKVMWYGKMRSISDVSREAQSQWETDETLTPEELMRISYAVEHCTRASHRGVGDTKDFANLLWKIRTIAFSQAITRTRDRKRETG